MSDFFDREGDRAYTRDYKESTPDVLAAFTSFNDAVFAREGREIPLKFRELIALAVGITTQCTYCIDGHAQAAVRAGASQAELAEAAWVATAIRAGGGFAHGRLAFKLSGIHDEQREHAHA
ncbi:MULTISPECIES: carboxymuconolactone decarboxylase family protein [Microbacterium]|uniref:carboxymuconolactone decarboxylase family protein n=1 Tax=Microbacterium TaxID=33882 RepID=UPI0027885035|nr:MULTISPECIES: carboxymuconolactone decarboxylase family protein [Microbacterium]MDQ1085112.1 AhpD family alkylhydroperoxidase [Microbacterium sp. SORGH_AS_0344]MDQ1169611.1 AhpD family alkylhydroperoxidase [Microbacterium proteolyticum]